MNYKNTTTMNLKGKIVIVTGASKGIGAGIARGFAEAGAKVIINYRSDEKGALDTYNAIANVGGEATVVKADVCVEADVEMLFEKTIKLYGKVDVLVNNAGVYKFEPIEAITEAEFHREFNTNVLSVVFACKQAAKHFTNGGTIINISSIASEMPGANTSLYSATKSAVDSFTIALAQELGPRNIRVNSILPGPVETEGNPVAGSTMEDFVISKTALGRVGNTEDISSIAVFLASDDARWITGQKITASGGFA